MIRNNTYKTHLLFSVLAAMADGILANAPMMALKGFGLDGKEWKLILQLLPTGIAMMLLLWLTGVMAVRPKKLFMFIPGVIYAFSIAFASFSNSAVMLLIMLGLGYTAESMTRPALTMIVRLNYPSSERGHLASKVRSRYYLVLIVSGLVSALTFDYIPVSQQILIKIELFLAALLLFSAYFFMSRLNINENKIDFSNQIPSPLKSLRDAALSIKKDKRFKKYIYISFFTAAGGLAVSPFIPVLLSRKLHFNYTQALIFSTVMVEGISVFTTPVIGKWIDKINVWMASSFTRIATSITDLLLGFSIVIYSINHEMGIVMAFAAAAIRGIVRGGQWVLWWQIAVNRFAVSDADSSRYTGIINFMNGIARIAGPLAGAIVLSHFGLQTVFYFGGAIVMGAALFSLKEYFTDIKNGGDVEVRNV